MSEFFLVSDFPSLFTFVPGHQLFPLTPVPPLHFILFPWLRGNRAFVLLFWCFTRLYPSRSLSQQSLKLLTLSILPFLYPSKCWSLGLCWSQQTSAAQRGRTEDGWDPPCAHFGRFCFGQPLAWSCGDQQSTPCSLISSERAQFGCPALLGTKPQGFAVAQGHFNGNTSFLFPGFAFHSLHFPSSLCLVKEHFLHLPGPIWV